MRINCYSDKFIPVEIVLRMSTQNTAMAAGLEGVVAADSSICYIDGAKGILSYRGYNIHVLAECASFEEVVYLLWHGYLPTRKDLAAFQASLIEQRGLGLNSSADGEAFLNNGDATLGVSMVALNTTPDQAASASTGESSRGSVWQINPAALRLAGQFVEQYVRSLDLNQFDSALLSRLYVVFEGRYLPEENIKLFGALIQAAFVLLALLPFFEPPVEGRKFANFFERELPWLGRIMGVAALAGLVWQLPRLAMFRILPAGIYLLLTVAIVLIGGMQIVQKRCQYLMLWRFGSTMSHQRRMLVLLLLMIYMGFMTLFSPFTAGAMLFVPFLLWAAVRFSQPRSYQVWLAIFGAWTVLHVASSVLVLYAIISRIPPWSFTALVTWMLCALLWLVVLVYVFSTPPLGLVERK